MAPRSRILDGSYQQTETEISKMSSVLPPYYGADNMNDRCN
jgi:hypothetical protein